MQSDVLAEVLKQRGVAKVFYFHADHFEPWGSGLNEKTAKATEHFAQQTRNSPYAAKLSLFYSTYVPHRLEFGGTDQPDARRANGDSVVFYQRSAQQDEMATNVIRPLVADGQHEMHLHVHHEWWTRNDSHLDSPVSHWVNAHSTGALDQQRLDLFFSLATSQIARETGTSFSRWGFVHGNWALAGSDRRICQIENELSMIMRHGGFGDFTFPAGRAICDPKIETPFTCRPLDLARAYDLAEADPSPVSHNTRIMQPERFFIWNSKIKADYSSLDYYYPPNRDRFKKTDLMVDNWLKNSVVIGDCLFVKTHAHSMYNYYNMADPASLIPHLYPDTVAVFDRLSKACDNAGVELRFVTVNEVMDVLHGIDGTEASPRSDELLAPGSAAPATVAPASVAPPPAEQPAEQPAPLEAGTKAPTIAPSTSPSFERTIAAALRDRNQAGFVSDEDRLLPDGARAIFTYVRAKFAPDSRHVVVGGHGNGALALLLAAAGFKVTAYEGNAPVLTDFKSAIAALVSLLPALPEKLQLIQGRYPDAFSLNAITDGQGSLLLATETGGSASTGGLERLMGSLAIFDDVVVGAAADKRLPIPFGRLHEVGEKVWSGPTNEIRHLRPPHALIEAAPAPASPTLDASTLADPPPRAGQPLQLDLVAFDAELVQMQRDWINGEGRNYPADDGYAVKVERNAILQTHELAIAAAIAETYETATTDLFEIGSGCGALALSLARHGFHVLCFEGDRRRHPASQSHLATQSRLHRGLDQRLRFVAGFFPEVFSLGLHRSGCRSVCIATNLTHSYTAKNQDLILRTAATFDEVILDLGRFGVNRDTQEERDRLLGGLLGSYYEPVELIYKHEPYEYWRLRARHSDRVPATGRKAAVAAKPPALEHPEVESAAETTAVEAVHRDRPIPLPLRDEEGLLFSVYGERQLAACPVCDSTDTAGLWRIPMSRLDGPINVYGGSMSHLPTRQVPASMFCYDFCRHCQTIFLNPVPDLAKERYRRDEYYVSKMAKPEEWRGYEELYQRFAPSIPANAQVMLDAASGIGQYLRIAQRQSPERWRRMIGLDLSRAYVDDMCKHGFEGHVFDLDEDDLQGISKPDSVDFITFCEAFEHVERPLAVLKKLLNVLRPGGRLFFTAQRYGKDATGPVRPSEHFYVGQKLVDQLPARLKCRVVEVTMSNMRYYVVLEK